MDPGAQPREADDPARVKIFRQQGGVGARGGVRGFRGHQHHDGPRPRRGGQGGEGQPEMIDHPELIGADNDGDGAQGGDQVAGIGVFTERTQETARALDQQPVKTPPQPAGMGHHLGKADALVFAAGGQQRGERGAKMPGVDFVQGQGAAEGVGQPAGVVAVAGTNGFEGGHVQSRLPEEPGEQRGQHGFTDAGVGAGDKIGGGLHRPISKRNPGRCANPNCALKFGVWILNFPAPRSALSIHAW